MLVAATAIDDIAEASVASAMELATLEAIAEATGQNVGVITASGKVCDAGSGLVVVLSAQRRLSLRERGEE